jgi:hypothetical protein
MILEIGLARAALVVVHDGEVLLERALELPHRWNQRRGGAAVHEQEDRVRRVLAAHAEPLVDATDLRLVRLLDPGRRDDAPQLLDRLAGLLVGRDIGALLRVGAHGHGCKDCNNERSRIHGISLC